MGLQLGDLPLHKLLLSTFTTSEIVRWGLFEAQYGGEIAAEGDIFAGEYGAKRLEDLKLRVIEHNVLVVTKYYTRISTARLAELLDLSPDKVSCWGPAGGCEPHMASQQQGGGKSQ